jgi:hypothetical protein
MDSSSVSLSPLSYLCDAREKRFLHDLIQQKEPGALVDHPMPELYAVLQAMERMWGGTDAGASLTMVGRPLSLGPPCR